jgi:hypothetical protein
VRSAIETFFFCIFLTPNARLVLSFAKRFKTMIEQITVGSFLRDAPSQFSLGKCQSNAFAQNASLFFCETCHQTILAQSTIMPILREAPS